MALVWRLVSKRAIPAHPIVIAGNHGPDLDRDGDGGEPGRQAQARQLGGRQRAEQVQEAADEYNLMV